MVVPVLLVLEACNKGTGPDGESKEVSEIDEESIYQSTSRWQTQDGDTVRLGMLSGRVPVVAMVFTHCPFACPRIVAEMKEIEESLSAAEKEKVVFVLVSFDTDRDDPDRLKAYAGEMELGTNWVLLHGGEKEVRELSMLLDVSYKQQPGGDFAHSNIITLLDKQGRIVKRVEGIGGNAKAMTIAVSDIL